MKNCIIYLLTILTVTVFWGCSTPKKFNNDEAHLKEIVKRYTELKYKSGSTTFLPQFKYRGDEYKYPHIIRFSMMWNESYMMSSGHVINNENTDIRHIYLTNQNGLMVKIPTPNGTLIAYDDPPWSALRIPHIHIETFRSLMNNSKDSKIWVSLQDETEVRFFKCYQVRPNKEDGCYISVCKDYPEDDFLMYPTKEIELTGNPFALYDPLFNPEVDCTEPLTIQRDSILKDYLEDVDDLAISRNKIRVNNNYYFDMPENWDSSDSNIQSLDSFFNSIITENELDLVLEKVLPIIIDATVDSQFIEVRTERLRGSLSLKDSKHANKIEYCGFLSSDDSKWFIMFLTIYMKNNIPSNYQIEIAIRGINCLKCFNKKNIKINKPSI